MEHNKTQQHGNEPDFITVSVLDCVEIAPEISPSFFNRLFGNPAPIIFAGTDYLFLASPSILGDQSDHSDVIANVVITECVLTLSARFADALSHKLGNPDNEFLEKFPMRAVGVTHVFVLGPAYAMAQDWRSAAFTVSVGIGNLVITGDVQKCLDATTSSHPGQGVRAYTDNPMVWFAAGLSFSASYSVESGAVILAVPLAVGAVYAVRNSEALRKTGTLTNDGAPNLCYATTMCVAGAGGMIALGPELEPALRAAFDAHIYGLAADADIRDQAFKSVAAISSFFVGAAYVALEQRYNPETFTDALDIAFPLPDPLMIGLPPVELWDQKEFIPHPA